MEKRRVLVSSVYCVWVSVLSFAFNLTLGRN